MTTERKAKQLKKRYERGVLNVARKIFNAETRRVAQVELGKTVLTKETTVEVDGKPTIVKTYSFPPKMQEPPTPPRLSWLGGKTYKQQGDSRRGRSGHGPEHAEAIPENASRVLAKEIDKALLPDVPAVDGVPVTTPAPEISEITHSETQVAI